MQFWNKSIICSLLRQGSEGEENDGGGGAVVVAFRLMAAARAARACARSSWSSFDPKKNGLVGDCSRFAIGALSLEF